MLPRQLSAYALFVAALLIALVSAATLLAA
jgi:hypothetical protein